MTAHNHNEMTWTELVNYGVEWRERCISAWIGAACVCAIAVAVFWAHFDNPDNQAALRGSILEKTQHFLTACDRGGRPVAIQEDPDTFIVQCIAVPRHQQVPKEG